MKGAEGIAGAGAKKERGGSLIKASIKTSIKISFYEEDEGKQEKMHSVRGEEGVEGGAVGTIVANVGEKGTGAARTEGAEAGGGERERRTEAEEAVGAGAGRRGGGEGGEAVGGTKEKSGEGDGEGKVGEGKELDAIKEEEKRKEETKRQENNE